MTKSEILNHIRFISAHEFASCKESRNGEHYKNQYSYKIMVYTSGSAYMEIGNKSGICRAGDAAFLLPGDTYRILNRFGDFSVINTYFGFCLPTVADQYTEQKYFNKANCAPKVTFDDAPMLNESFFTAAPAVTAAAVRLLHLCSCTQNDGFVSNALVCNMLAELISVFSDTNEEKIRIDRCITENLCNGINAASAAALLKIHPVHLNRLMKKYMHCTTSEYIMQKKIERAKLYLIETNMSVTDIAYTLGFFDSAHFSGKFKKLSGLTPTEYKMGAVKSAGAPK